MTDTININKYLFFAIAGLSVITISSWFDIINIVNRYPSFTDWVTFGVTCYVLRGLWPLVDDIFNIREIIEKRKKERIAAQRPLYMPTQARAEVNTEAAKEMPIKDEVGDQSLDPATARKFHQEQGYR